MTLALLAGPVTASSLAQQGLDLYLMDIQASGQRLQENVATYQAGDTYFVHLTAFLEAVEFPIQEHDRVWSGWFRTPDSVFYWDVDSGELRVHNVPRFSVSSRVHSGKLRDNSPTAPRLSAGQWIESDEGMFVSMRALESWFNLDLTPSARLQTITVVSSEPLPFQQRAARESAKNSYRPGQRPVVDIRVPDQYQWATLPLFDLSYYRRIQNAGGEQRSSAQTGLTLGMDLFKHSVLYSGSSAEDHNQRLTIERLAETSNGTLFLGLDRYALGDILGTRSNLVSTGGSGLGFNLERRRSNRGSSLNRLTISGNAPPGWEAELYRNGELITFGSVSRDGRYVFTDQETVYGENVFLVRLFGPQGQIREERHRHWANAIELAEGDYNYSLSHIEFSERFVEGERPGANALASEGTTDVRYTHALTGNLQVGVGYTWARLGSRATDGTFTNSEYATLDGRMKLGRGLLLAEGVHQQEHGTAWALQYLTSVYGHNVNIAHQAFSNFESPYTVRRTKLRAQNQITLSGPLSRAGLNSYTLRFTHHERADGLTDYRIFSRLGLRAGPVTSSNDLEYFHLNGGDDFYLGRLRISGHRRRLSFRGQLDYDPADARPLNQVSGTIRWNVSKRLHNTLTVFKGLKNGRALWLDNTLTVRIGRADLTLSVTASSDDLWAVGVGINRSFAYDRASRRFVVAERSLAHTGRATLNLFLDRNNNGVREPGEFPVSWFAYKDQAVSASAAGGVKLTGLQAGYPVHLQARHFRFDDPFLSMRSKVYELYTHAGSDIRVDVPVIVTGDVEGYLRPVPGTDNAAVSGVQVTLYDLDGETVAVTRSEFDGYYSFLGIPVGQYDIGLRPKSGYHLQRFSLDGDSYRLVDAIYIR